MNSGSSFRKLSGVVPVDLEIPGFYSKSDKKIKKRKTETVKSPI
jgi:hypothetical protein